MSAQLNTSSVEILRPVQPVRNKSPDPSPGWLEYLGPAGVAKVIVLGALLLVLYWDRFTRMVQYWQEPDWSHGFLMPFFSLYLVNMRRPELIGRKAEGSLWGLALMLLSAVIYAYTIYARIGYPQDLSILSMLAGLVLLLRGWRTFWLTAFPIAILVLAMPPPDRLYRAFTQPLQQFAAGAARVVLNLLPGAEVERQGINISYWMREGRSGAFTVAGACSGMRSLMAFVALGLMMAYFTPRPMWHRLVMAAIVVPVALTCNVLRVVITGALQMYGKSELSAGTPHTILGLLMFALGFSLYLGALWLLDHLFVDDVGGEE